MAPPNIGAPLPTLADFCQHNHPLVLFAAVKAAADFNILGIISFSVFFAVVLSSLGPQADPIINTINILNVVIERMVKAILSVSPVGIASIIAARVISTCSLASMAQRSRPRILFRLFP
jgi:Na+/H+-dicarboxylate symporter